MISIAPRRGFLLEADISGIGIVRNCMVAYGIVVLLCFAELLRLLFDAVEIQIQIQVRIRIIEI